MDIEKIIEEEKKKAQIDAIDELIKWTSDHYWDSLHNDAHIIRLHLIEYFADKLNELKNGDGIQQSC